MIEEQKKDMIISEILDPILPKIRNIKNNCIYQQIPERLLDQAKSKLFISGGCFASFICGEQPKDYDVFSTDKKFMAELIECFIEDVNRLTNNKFSVEFNPLKKVYYIKDCCGILEDGGSVLIEPSGEVSIRVSKCAFTIGNVQYVIIGRFAMPEGILQEFDFEHCKIYSMLGDEEISFVGDAPILAKEKDLKISRPKFILSCVRRVGKFIKRGWKMDNEQRELLHEMLQNIDVYRDSKLIEEFEGMYV